MTLLECELSQAGVRMPAFWSLVNGRDGGEASWSDLARHNRRVLKTVAEFCTQEWRERHVKVAWHHVDPVGRVDHCSGWWYGSRRIRRVEDGVIV